MNPSRPNPYGRIGQSKPHSITRQRKSVRNAQRNRKPNNSQARRKCSFTQSDLSRAVKALEKQGKIIGAVSFDGHSGFTVQLASSLVTPASTNEWDDVLVGGAGA